MSLTSMTEGFLEKTKQRLKKERAMAEEELSRFAKKDVRPKGDWDTQFPYIDGGSGGEEALEDKAKSTEEYERLLPVEFALEKKIKNIDLALERIKKGNYGICEKCQKKIKKQRLLAIPEARFCMKCQK